MKLLVIDSDAKTAARMRGYLMAKGHQVATISQVDDIGGHGAIAIDPGVGIVFAELRQVVLFSAGINKLLAQCSEAILVTMSSNRVELAPGSAITCEVAAHLQKPVTFEELDAVIKRATDGSFRRTTLHHDADSAHFRLTKVLTVDDSTLIQTMYRTMLINHSPDCQVLQASNGELGLDTLSQEPGIELILLDVNMPVMNGIGFLTAIKQTPFRNIPVIMVTTEGKEADAMQGLQLGAKAYLVKPFNPKALNQVIDAVLNRVGQRAPK